jgi:hypothetical protein
VGQARKSATSAMGLPVSKRTYSPPNLFCPTQRRWESALCWPRGGIPPIAHQGEPPITDLLQNTSITKESVKEGKEASFTLTLTCGRPTDSTTGIPGKESVGDDLSGHGPGDSRQLAANFLRATSRLRVLLLALDSFHIFNGQAGSPCGGGLGVNPEQRAYIVS